MQRCDRGSLGGMPTLVLDPPPAAFAELLEQRRRHDQDRRDEVWEGVVHMIPPPSHEHERIASRLHRVLGPLADDAGLELTGAVGIGSGQEDYRVPDLALHRPGAAAQLHPTAALVVEIVSPGDESWETLPFYAARQVHEVVIVDPRQSKVDWLSLGEGGEYRPAERSGLIELGPAELKRQLDLA
jgi:Uma2 family endonuclease